jgi:hypothetical protein
VFHLPTAQSGETPDSTSIKSMSALASYFCVVADVSPASAQSGETPDSTFIFNAHLSEMKMRPPDFFLKVFRSRMKS